MTNAQNLLRDALLWFDSHEVQAKLGHLPQWVAMARSPAPPEQSMTEALLLDVLLNQTVILAALTGVNRDEMRAVLATQIDHTRTIIETVEKGLR